jgi:hypothetical protein
MKLFEDKADYEDFVDFAVGTAWVLLFTLIASGIALLVMVALGWIL